MNSINNLNIVTSFTAIFLENFIVQRKKKICPRKFEKRTFVIYKQPMLV